MELVEHLAKIAIKAQALGGVRLLPSNLVQKLLAKRASAGLGAAADRAINRQRPVIACAPAPHANVPTESAKTADLATIIRDEIQRVLGR